MTTVSIITRPTDPLLRLRIGPRHWHRRSDTPIPSPGSVDAPEASDQDTKAGRIEEVDTCRSATRWYGPSATRSASRSRTRGTLYTSNSRDNRDDRWSHKSGVVFWYQTRPG
jgi:hypothetical protein